jgi:hypothetical protein
MIAAIYARKSTDDSDKNKEARSTTRQIERGTEYAQAKGWMVDPRYVFVDDAVSGDEWKHRPGWNALIAALDPRPPFLRADRPLAVPHRPRHGAHTGRGPPARTGTSATRAPDAARSTRRKPSSCVVGHHERTGHRTGIISAQIDARRVGLRRTSSVIRSSVGNLNGLVAARRHTGESLMTKAAKPRSMPR